ncbi:MAG: Smr/MutS family protein [Proteobacteria bacterium]|nr:Smr/MutS family protein [Pseudomonadota bacterium]
MSKNKRDLTADERKLWGRVASTVKARRRAPATDEGDCERARPLQRKGAPAADEPRKPVQTARAAAPPQDRSDEKRVRRGDVAIGAVLDLHGHTHDLAFATLARFLHRAQKRGQRAVIVITGVGRGGEGVLKRMLPAWLAAKEIRPLIAGYARAHRSHGGAGAFYVFVKRARDEHG